MVIVSQIHIYVTHIGFVLECRFGDSLTVYQMITAIADAGWLDFYSNPLPKLISSI